MSKECYNNDILNTANNTSRLIGGYSMFKGKWTEKLTNVLLWVGGYVNFIAFALLGGYIIVKGNDKQKLTIKKVFIIVLLFLGATAIMELFYNFASMSGDYYGSFAQDIYSIMTKIINIAKIGVFATFVILELIKKDKTSAESMNNIEQPKNDV